MVVCDHYNQVRPQSRVPVYFLLTEMETVSKLILFICLVLGCSSYVGCQHSAISLTEDNWGDILEGEWMVEFMAPWCPACRSFKETWNKFSTWGRDLDIGVAVIDVTESPGLSGRFLITALPSIYHVKDGEFRQYMGSRQDTDLIAFIDEKKWQDIEPVSKWYTPSSIQMATVGTFFKVAMWIRSLYSMMTDDYGIPEWGCYVIFAIVTIITGLVMGLLIVFCCDHIMPSKEIPPPIPQELMRPEKDEEGDIIDDTVKEDGDAGVRRRNVEASKDDPRQSQDEESSGGDDEEADAKGTEEDITKHEKKE